MPQKHNPDVAELARGKTGRIYGHLISLLVTMKALPLAYNRDMQEDKEGFFDTVETMLPTLGVFTGMIKTLKVDVERTHQAAEEGYILATDLADYLVNKGIPFRQAHNIVAKLVCYAEREGKSLHQLDIDEYQRFSPLFGQDVYSLTAKSSIAARNIPGGTALEQVEAQLARARKIIADDDK
jgi:argininosuccinate lyase